MASSGLRKMLISIIIQHLMVYECWCVLQFYAHSDVHYPKPWQMLCHSVIEADGMPLADCHMILWQMVNHRGRCYNLLLSKVAAVIAIMFMCGRW